MRSLKNTISFFLVGMIGLFAFYYYLDNVYFAPNASFKVVDATPEKKEKTKDFSFVKSASGDKYYSFDRHYMAQVKPNSVDIYTAGKPLSSIDVNLKGRSVSFFDWMPDRNLGIIALYGGDTPDTVVLEQFNPESPDHKQDTKIDDLPRGSKIVDVVYSTATNAVYMKVRVGENAYRVYRTDANYDTRRIHLQATNVGRIATFYDEDKFIYDNQRTGVIYLFTDKTGGWRIISPVGRYYFIGADKDKTIYIAKVNKQGEVLAVSDGKLGVGFEELYKYDKPVSMDELTVESVKKEYKERQAQKAKEEK